MDDVTEHNGLKAERYSMAINHVLSHGDDIYTLRLTKIRSDDPNFFLFEVFCFCGWWDHWDERKEDWSGNGS